LSLTARGRTEKKSALSFSASARGRGREVLLIYLRGVEESSFSAEENRKEGPVTFSRRYESKDRGGGEREARAASSGHGREEKVKPPSLSRWKIGKGVPCRFTAD